MPLSTDKISLPIFLEFFKQRQVPLDEIKDFEGESIEKILKYWRTQELVPFMEKGKWARISFADLIWLRILDTLRQFSYPVSKMKKICDYFFKDASDNNLPQKNLENAIAQLELKKIAGTITEEENELLENQQNILNNHPIILEQLKGDVNYLTNLIHISINSGMEGGILIFADGSVCESFKRNIYFNHTDLVDNNVISKIPHLFLSITFYLQELIDQDDLSYMMLPQILNEDEAYVLNQIRNKNIDQLAIELKDGKIINIQSTENGMFSESENKEIKRILGLKNYEKITINTRDEKTLSFKRIRMKKAR